MVEAVGELGTGSPPTQEVGKYRVEAIVSRHAIS